MSMVRIVHIMRSMNKLPLEKRVQILTLLVEGSSLRSISWVAGVSINTVTKLLVDAGMTCATFRDKAVRNVKAKRIQCDEIRSLQCKGRQGRPCEVIGPRPTSKNEIQMCCRKKNK